MAISGNGDELHELIKFMATNNYCDSTYRCFPKEISSMSARCFTLISKDYNVKELCNDDGSLCPHYPPSLYLSSNTTKKWPLEDLYNLISQAKYARCRTRFVFPAFEFNGKNVCRSSTLSVPLEVYGRQVASAAGFTFDGSTTSPALACDAADPTCSISEDGRSTLTRLRDDDCELLKRFQVTYICDLMLEYRKVKYWVPITSSEKADSHIRYQDFTVLALPYPGSEFFRIWRDSGYVFEGTLFNWEQSIIDVELHPESIPITNLSRDVVWNDYKSWDLATLTANYLKLLLGLMFEGNGGILLHCVSGWDRTPLFVSLLRCLLWSEQLVHRSLSPHEMLYYTLAYDWFLFGHQLHTRLEAGEEVLRFGFTFLAHLVDRHPEMCLRKTYDTIVPTDEVNSDGEPLVELDWPPNMIETRRQRLSAISNLFLTVWDHVISGGVCQCPSAESIPLHRPSSSTDPHEILVCKTPEPDSLEADNSLLLENEKPPTSVISQISSVVSSAAAVISCRLTNPLLTHSLHSTGCPPAAQADSPTSSTN